MINATGERIRWTDLPGHVRTAVEDILGDRVATSESQPGGFSPGTAERGSSRRGGSARSSRR